MGPRESESIAVLTIAHVLPRGSAAAARASVLHDGEHEGVGHGGRASTRDPIDETGHREDSKLAVRTRLELATSGVTGQCSNQLNYRTAPVLGGHI